jgi:tetratricopeptide (TPR) repeat protein
LCEFDAALAAYSEALRLSRKIGDDLRSAIITSNMCVASLHRGDFVSAVTSGELSLAMACRALSPRLVNIHLNLAIALLMQGERTRALRSIEAAQEASRHERSWVATMEFLLGFASASLIMGNVTATLELVERAEEVAWGKERASPNAGLFDQLRVFRAAHNASPSVAQKLAIDAREKYRDRHLFYYLQIVTCSAWLERRLFGRHTQETERDLRLFETHGAHGARAIFAAHGFLA